MGVPQNIIGRLNQFAVETLGIAAPQLSAQWASANPVYNGPTAAQPFTLTFATEWFAPFTGVYANQVKTPHFDLNSKLINSNPATDKLSVLRFHPQAAARLADLYAARYGAGGAPSHSIRPVPASLLLRLNAAPPTDKGLLMTRAGDQSPLNQTNSKNLPAATVSFHDQNGLILDPIAVAAAFTDILRTFPLLGPNTGTFAATMLTGAAGWVDAIGGMDNTVRGYVQVVNPHGGAWEDPGTGMGLSLASGGQTQRFTGPVPLAFAAGATVQAEDTTVQTAPGKTQVRFGYATWGRMANTALALNIVAPAAATTLNRDFVRLIAVDLNRFLLGNVTAQAMGTVPALDSKSVNEPHPVVREGSTIRLQRDGLGVLGETAQLLAAFGQVAAPDKDLAFLVSPAIDPVMSLPADASANSRWGKAASADICPTDITPTSLPTGDWSTLPADAPALKSLRAEGTACTATWASATGTDVLVKIAPGILPPGAHVRVYDRLFVITPDLAHNPTLFRGDGAARIAGAITNETHLVLRNPFNLTSQPSKALLHFDLHVLPNNGPTSRERIFGGYALKVGPFAAQPAASHAGTNLAATMNGKTPFEGVCTSRFLGLTPGGSLSWPGNPVDVVKTVAQLVRGSMTATAGAPAEAARLPTMARYESIAATCVLKNGTTTPTYGAVLSGGFLTPEMHCELYHQGNPGGPATGETHVSGLFADGWLGHDLAVAACRRAQPLQDRVLSLGLSQFDDPAAPASASSISGAVLQTVAAGVETPELVFIPEDQLASLPNTVQDLQNLVNGAVGNVFTLTLPSTPGKGGDRAVAEVKREAYAAHYGRRDWQTSLRYALTHARELIYLETQCLTPSPSATNADYAFDVIDDVVAGLVTRLSQERSLRLILVSPKVFPYGPNYQGWAQYFYEQRKLAWAKLMLAAPDRILAVHPIGFPGRPLNVRTSVCIIDDVWASVGTGVPRRRGLSFDGSIDVSLFDAQIANGRGLALANFRRSLMAQILNVQQPAPGVTPDLNWTRLAHPRTAFDAFAELVEQGGRGLVEPKLWDGPDMSPNAAQVSVKAASQALADPEGREAKSLLDALALDLAIFPTL